jgi:hypothetical protein
MSFGERWRKGGVPESVESPSWPRPVPKKNLVIKLRRIRGQSSRGFGRFDSLGNHLAFHVRARIGRFPAIRPASSSCHEDKFWGRWVPGLRGKQTLVLFLRLICLEKLPGKNDVLNQAQAKRFFISAGFPANSRPGPFVEKSFVTTAPAPTTESDGILQYRSVALAPM